MSTPAAAFDAPLDARLNTYLVGDIGGTNCRLALVQAVDGQVRVASPTDYKCADFPEAYDAIDRYLHAVDWTGALSGGVLAIAGPVRDGAVQSTNMPWRLSEADLQRRGLPNARLINDYTALALAVDQFAPRDLIALGPDVAGEPSDTVAVMGAGTGFGAGALARGVGGTAVIATEGGHIAFAPTDDVEIEILKILRRMFGRVSVERLLSGPGLVNIHTALAQIEGAPAPAMGAEAIVAEAASADGLARRTLDRFCAIYGAVAGDLALAYGARGGVYLGGGIAPAIAGRLQAGGFRQSFEDKGRFRAYVAAIPTKVIANTHAALLGAGSLAAGLSRL
ncbi:MAG TPA: glucokinase [Caulobacteraceae bacterium]|nr:glucokinase [Caulobacteraceae bacterium]